MPECSAPKAFIALAQRRAFNPGLDFRCQWAEKMTSVSVAAACSAVGPAHRDIVMNDPRVRTFVVDDAARCPLGRVHGKPVGQNSRVAFGFDPPCQRAYSNLEVFRRPLQLILIQDGEVVVDRD